jgi:hypothetical protein
MKIEYTGGVHRRLFESFADFLSYCERPDAGTGCSRKLDTRNPPWCGTKDWDGAMLLAREGWREGMEKVQNLLAKIESVTGSMALRPEPVWDVCGGAVDVGRFCSGEPENMIEFQDVEIPAAGKVVSLIVNGCVSGGHSTDLIIKKGTVALALVDALENAGRRVEVTVCFNHGKWEAVIPLKASSEHVEMDRLAFMLAHPSTLRRLIFHCMEQEPDASVRQAIGVTSQGYGMPGKTAMHADILIPENLYSSSSGSDDKALAWVMDELKRQGVEVEKVS